MYYNREHRFSPNMEFFIYGSMDTRTSEECNMKNVEDDIIIGKS